MVDYELEKIVAEGWFDGRYDEESARLTAELQGLDWEKIESHYGDFYANAECVANRGYYND